MTWFTGWFRKPIAAPYVGTAESYQAVEDSQLILEVTKDRWKRINETAARAEHANSQMKSQRDQNHLAEIVSHAMHGRTRA